VTVVAGFAGAGLTGCAPSFPTPIPISSAESAEWTQTFLDSTWQRTGLEGTAPRPRGNPIPANGRNWTELVLDCLTDSGISGYGMVWGSDGAALSDANGATVTDPRVTRPFYRCVAAHPPSAEYDFLVLSPSQKDYLSRYWAQWLAPCLRQHGHEPAPAPPVDELFPESGGFTWGPYFALLMNQYADYSTALDRLTAECGPQFGTLQNEIDEPLGAG
jgi:hypothetical protein